MNYDTWRGPGQREIKMARFILALEIRGDIEIPNDVLDDATRTVNWATEETARITNTRKYVEEREANERAQKVAFKASLTPLPKDWTYTNCDVSVDAPRSWFGKRCNNRASFTTTDNGVERFLCGTHASQGHMPTKHTRR